MIDDGWVRSFPEQTEWLQSSAEVEVWLETAFRGRGTYPLLFTSRDDTDEDLVIRHFRNSHDLAFKRRFHLAIANLLKGWHFGDDPDYLARVVTVAGATAQPASEETAWHILQHVSMQRLRSTRPDVHALLLRTLVGLREFITINGCISVLQRDIYIPRYSSICYVGLCRLDPVYVLQYLPVVVACAASHPQEVALEPVLRSVITVVGWRPLYQGLFDVLRPDCLSREHQQLLVGTLLRAAPVNDKWIDSTVFLVATHAVDESPLIITMHSRLLVFYEGLYARRQRGAPHLKSLLAPATVA